MGTAKSLHHQFGDAICGNRDGTKCLSEEDCRALGDLRHTLEEHRRLGLTDKNIALIRKVLSAGVWTKVLQLPQAMMAEARRLKSSSQFGPQ